MRLTFKLNQSSIIHRSQLSIQDAAGQSANCGIELQVFEGKKAQVPGDAAWTLGNHYIHLHPGKKWRFPSMGVPQKIWMVYKGKSWKIPFKSI